MTVENYIRKYRKYNGGGDSGSNNSLPVNIHIEKLNIFYQY